MVCTHYKWILAQKLIIPRYNSAKHQTEHRDLNGGVRGRTEGAEGDCNPIERAIISTNQIP